MKYMFPNYNHGLINVISSIEKHFKINPIHKSLPELDNILKENNSKNVILFLFDGLGYNILKDNKDICPFLYKNLVGSVSSTFPSTTMAARTTIESGLNPIEHGWLGWDMYFKDFDEVITLTRNVIKGTKVKPADYHVAKTLLNYEPVTKMIDKKEGYIGRTLRTYSNHRNESLRKLRKEIKRLTKSKDKTYIYAYYNEPDHALHKYGVGSKEMRKYLKYIDKEFKKVCKSLKNTTVIAIADHGHLNVEYITLTDYPNIIKMLKGNVAIDSRACSFRVKNEYKKTFPMELQKILKDDFIIMSAKDINDKNLYGTGKENKYYKDGLGDYIAIGIGNKSIRYDDNVHMHKSTHSGLTEVEMMVPLVVVNVDNV